MNPFHYTPCALNYLKCSPLPASLPHLPPASFIPMFSTKPDTDTQSLPIGHQPATHIPAPDHMTQHV